MTTLPAGWRPEDWTHKGLGELTAEEVELCRRWVARYGIEGPKITGDRGMEIASVLVMSTPHVPGHFQLWLAGVIWCHPLIAEADVWRQIAEAVNAP